MFREWKGPAKWRLPISCPGERVSHFPTQVGHPGKCVSLIFPREATAVVTIQGRNVWIEAGMGLLKDIDSQQEQENVPSCKLCPMSQGDSSVSVMGISRYLDRTSCVY